MPTSDTRVPRVRGGGVRLQFFVALAIAVIVAGLTAAVTAYHVFDRELERAFNARLDMLVGEAGRVLDAGIAAGLELDRPQLQERALKSVRPNLGPDEVIAVINADGRIVASTNSAEIGSNVALGQLSSPSSPDAVEPGSTRFVTIRPIESLFGVPAGHVTARVGPAVLDQPRRTFMAKVAVQTAAFTLAGLLAAALLSALLPWRARRMARGIEQRLGQLYDGIGTEAEALPSTIGVTPEINASLDRFAAAVAAREHELRAHANAIDLLDEAA